MTRSTYIDLSHPIRHGMITYQGLPAPEIKDFLSREASRKNYAKGTEFHIAGIDMVSNTGTYIDTPFHRYAEGDDLSVIPLEKLVNIEGIVIRIEGEKTKRIDHRFFLDKDLKNKAVLVHTGFDKNWNTDDYFHDHPFLTKDAAEYLVYAEVILTGIDSYNIDDTNDLSRPVHSILLKNDILIIEHMCNLNQLPDSGFRFTAVPQKFIGVGSFPVRAFATM